jgi:hypothetical protein
METFGQLDVRGQETRAQPQTRVEPQTRAKRQPARATFADIAAADREHNEALIELLAEVASSTSKDIVSESRPGASRDVQESHDAIWALEWL